MLNQPTSTPDSTPWEALQTQLDLLTATLAAQTAERAEVDHALARADLDSDPERADALRDRALQLTATIAEHERQAAQLTRQMDTAHTAAGHLIGRISHAKQIITALTSSAGLAHPALRQVAARDLPQRVAIARQRLAAVGEAVPPITITL